MYLIKNVKQSNIDEVRSFLLEVPTIKEVDDQVLNNGIVLYYKKKIHMVVSYEIINDYALIRYFVYKRSVDKMFITELFNIIEEKLLKEDAEYMMTVANNKELLNLFS